jgi:uncharacterized protein (TIGR00297 family)
LGVSIVLLTPLAARALAGLVIAGVIAGSARRTRSLSASGAWAATAVSALSIAAGWVWGALLIAFFVASTVLSRIGEAEKSARTADIVAKGGERDAAQVLANGGVFALCALGSIVVPRDAGAWHAVGAGALAAATADTWATEIGTLIGRAPRSIISFSEVPPGTSGGVTTAGTAAAVAGATFLAGMAFMLGWSSLVAWGALVGGVAGATADSLIGATAQARRRCDRCNTATERGVHRCGAVTVAAGGLAWLDNDAVNAMSTAVGAVVSWGVWRARA